MLQVHQQTVKLLYRAQEKRLRGHLRLDISSRAFPRDPTRPVDIERARQAIGERVVRTVGGCAVDAVLRQTSPVYLSDTSLFPPATAAGQLLRVMPDASHFEKFVEHRLAEVLGLEQEAGAPERASALSHLANDVHSWVGQQGEARQLCGLELIGAEVFVRCPEVKASFPDLP